MNQERLSNNQNYQPSAWDMLTEKNTANKSERVPVGGPRFESQVMKEAIFKKGASLIPDYAAPDWQKCIETMSIKEISEILGILQDFGTATEYEEGHEDRLLDYDYNISEMMGKLATGDDLDNDEEEWDDTEPDEDEGEDKDDGYQRARRAIEQRIKDGDTKIALAVAKLHPTAARLTETYSLYYEEKCYGEKNKAKGEELGECNKSSMSLVLSHRKRMKAEFDKRFSNPLKLQKLRKNHFSYFNGTYRPTAKEILYMNSDIGFYYWSEKYRSKTFIKRHPEIYKPTPETVRKTIAPKIEKFHDLSSDLYEKSKELKIDSPDFIKSAKDYSELICKTLGITNPPTIDLHQRRRGNSVRGSYMHQINAVDLYLSKEKSDKVASIIAHELFHAYQYQESQLDHNKLYSMNFRRYISSSNNTFGYLRQLVEAEAYEFDSQISKILKKEYIDSQNNAQKGR